ncbi:MAG: AEC family transporter [Balneolales bacterium]
MLQAAESLVPIILLVCLGAVLFYKQRFLSNEVRMGLDWFTYWIALPSLFIHSLSGTDFGGLEAGNLVLTLMGSAVAVSLLASLITRMMKLSKEHSGVFVQASFRGNLAFVGLPLIIFSLNGADMSNELVTEALIILAALIPLYNVISIYSLISAKTKIKPTVIFKILFQMVKNPLIISAVAGALLGWLNWDLPIVIDRPFELLGQTALALALVSLGGALVQLKILGNLRLAIFTSLLKVAAVPIITYILGQALDLSADRTFIAMVFAACPTAVASYILTTQLGGDQGLAAASVITSTIFSLVALTVILMIF